MLFPISRKQQLSHRSKRMKMLFNKNQCALLEHDNHIYGFSYNDMILEFDVASSHMQTYDIKSITSEKHLAALKNILNSLDSNLQ